MVRTEPTADASLAAIRERSKFGIAMAAMIRMIATTISNSISEKPFCFRISIFSPKAFVVVIGAVSTAYRNSRTLRAEAKSYQGDWTQIDRGFVFSARKPQVTSAKSEYCQNASMWLTSRVIRRKYACHL